MEVWLGVLFLVCVTNAFYLPGLAPTHFCEEGKSEDGCLVS